MLLNKRIPLKFLFNKVKKEFFLVFGYVTVVAVLHEFFDMPKISLAIPGILGTAISLILAFRTNQAYQRWWEARKIWGGIFNDSRSLIRQVVTFTHFGTDSLKDSEIDNLFANRQIAWCYSLSRSLRNQDPLQGLDKHLGEEDMEFVRHQANVPNAILMLHGWGIKKLEKEEKVNDYQQISLDRTLSNLCDHMGKCERIKNTVFPKTYTLFVEFLLVIFILLLPFGVIEFSSFFQRKN